VENTQMAAGDEGIYDAKAETLQLRPTGPPRPSPWVVNQEVDISGRRIDIDIKQDAIDASGQISFTRTPTAAKAKESQATGLFESGKPIKARSNTLKYSKATGIAAYGGDVTVLQDGTGGQEGSQLRADEVTVDDKKQDISATGRVRSTFYIEQVPDEPGKKGPTQTVLTSERMTYIEATRTAIYTGKATMDSGEGANKQGLEAEVITLVMQGERRALKNLVATASGTGIVLAKLPEGRQATGLRLTYDAEKDVYVMTGKPAQFVTRSTTRGPEICDVGTGDKIDFPRTEGVANVTTGGGIQGRMDAKRCVEVLK
jgi:lipopolysaccharide export system protein LptA